MGVLAVDCSKATFSSTLFPQPLPVSFLFHSSAPGIICSLCCGITWVSCSLFSCSSLARPSLPLPPSIALNNFGVSCFCVKRPAKPRGCCTGGPGAGFPFSFSSTLETGRNENMWQGHVSEQSSCKAKMSCSWMKIWQNFQGIFLFQVQWQEQSWKG